MEEKVKNYFEFKDLYIDSYQDIDTLKNHNIIICEYEIDDIGKYHIVIGEALGDITDIMEDLKKLAMFRMVNFGELFVCFHINKICKSDSLNKINFSKVGYNFLFNRENNFDLKNELYGKSYEIVLDSMSHRFSYNGTDNPFNPFHYFEELKITEKQKNTNKVFVKKVI